MSTTGFAWPDVALLVSEHLRAGLDDEVAVSDRVQPDRPSVMVARVGGPRGQILDQARILLEVRHDIPEGAWAITALCRELVRRLPGAHDEGTVTGVTETGGPAYLPDPLTGTPRYTLAFVATVKPNPAPTGSV